MTSIATILERIARTTGCTVLKPSGVPPMRPQDRLPEDLRDFYELCGGVRLFDGRLYPMRIVEPHSFARSNLEIVGDDFPDDITDSWYIVARGGSDQLISVDCHPDRLGRCYDSFWDRHGVADSCPIVALSFTELLSRLVDAKGGNFFQLVEQVTDYGDAYGSAPQLP